MTSANIQIGAGDVTALLVQRHVDALEEEIQRLRAEREWHWRVLEAAIVALDAQGEAKYNKLKPALEQVAQTFRVLHGSGKYVVGLAYLGKQEHAVACVFGRLIQNMPWDTPMKLKDARFALSVGIYRQDGHWTTENLLPPGHSTIPVKLTPVDAKAVDAALMGIHAIDKATHAMRERLKDIPAIERKARATMTETLLAGLEPSVLRQIEGCMPSSRKVIETSEAS